MKKLNSMHLNFSQRPNKIEGSLNVVAQTLMDACSTQESHLTKDSPSSKLLFANELQRYRQWVGRFYAEIREMAPIPEEEMRKLLAMESRPYSTEQQLLPNTPKLFTVLNELYGYVSSQRELLMDELAGNEFALQQRLPEKVQRMFDTMEPNTSTTLGDVVSNAGGLSNGSLEHGYNSKSRLMGGNGAVPGANSRFY